MFLVVFVTVAVIQVIILLFTAATAAVAMTTVTFSFCLASQFFWSCSRLGEFPKFPEQDILWVRCPSRCPTTQSKLFIIVQQIRYVLTEGYILNSQDWPLFQSCSRSWPQTDCQWTWGCLVPRTPDPPDCEVRDCSWAVSSSQTPAATPCAVPNTRLCVIQPHCNSCLTELISTQLSVLNSGN